MILKTIQITAIVTIILLFRNFICSAYPDSSTGLPVTDLAANSKNEEGLLQNEELERQILVTQEQNAVRQAKQPESGKQETEAYVTYFAPVKSKDNISHVRILESDFDYSYEFKLFDKIPFTFSLDNEYVDIKQNSSLSLPSHLVGMSMGLETILPFFNVKNTYISTGVNPSFLSDDWNFKSSAFRIPVNNFLIYNLSDKLTFIGGVAVFPDFKNVILPIGGFIYKPNEKIILNITSENPSIAYCLNDKITFFAEAQTPVANEFEVEHNGSDGVVLIYNDIRLGAGVQYKFNKNISASVAVGAAFDRYLRYRDIDGKLSIKNGIYNTFTLDVQM